MASITPEDNELPLINEGDNFSVTFNYELLSDETFVDIKITDNNLPLQVIINDATFSGNLSGLFILPDGSLKYRYGDELLETNSFNNLPPKGTVDLYSFSAPRMMLNTYNINVELTYLKGAETLKITKSYIQKVRGNWSTFRDLFLNYLE